MKIKPLVRWMCGSLGMVHAKEGRWVEYEDARKREETLQGRLTTALDVLELPHKTWKDIAPMPEWISNTRALLKQMEETQ